MAVVAPRGSWTSAMKRSSISTTAPEYGQWRRGENRRRIGPRLAHGALRHWLSGVETGVVFIVPP
jgi:hypothetical protein